MKPIILDSTSKSITAVMSGAAATTNPDFTSHYADHATTTFTPGSNDGTLNGTTPVTLVAAPAASTQRTINQITIANTDTAPVTIEIFEVNGVNSRRIWYGTLVVNGSFTFEGVFDENGALQTAIATIPAHGHTDSTNGGTLSAAAIASGTLVAARGGLGADASAFSGLIAMASGVASVATPGTDYLAPGIDHTDISDFSEAVDDRVDALTVAGVGIDKVYNDAGNSLTINALTYWRQPVRVVAVSNVSVSSAPSSIDSVTLNSGDRVLLTNQSTGAENGPWVFNGASSAMTRPTDYPAASTIFAYQDELYFVRSGTVYSSTVWRLTTSGAITVDTTATAWSQITWNANSLGTMTGDSGSGGAKGAVPAPAAGDATKFLRGDGTWDVPAHAFAVIEEQQTSGTAGGTSTATTWTQRVLNTEVVDADNIVTIASNKFTPIAGIFRVEVWSPFAANASTGGGGRIRLYNVTAAAEVARSNNYPMLVATNTVMTLVYQITANGTDEYEIDYYVGVGRTTNGLGVPVNEASAVERYTRVMLTQIG